MARCKIYEIQGPDPARTAAAVRCHRTADAKVTIGNRKFDICKKHQGSGWELFERGGWLYAVDLNSKPPKRRN